MLASPSKTADSFPSASPPSSGRAVTVSVDSPHRVLPATPADVEAILIEGLRPADVRELKVIGREPKASLWESFLVSTPLAYTLHVSDYPAAIFGAAATEVDGVGAVWMLGSDRMYGAKEALRVEAALWMDHLNEVYPVLTNLVHVENTASLAWCAALGYEISEPFPFNSTHLQRITRCVQPKA